MATVKVKFFVGQGLTKDGTAIPQLAERRKVALDLVCQEFGGFTATTIIGGWKEPKSGNLVMEEVLAITAFMNVGEKIGRGPENVAKALRELFFQDTVFMSFEPDNVETEVV